MTTREVLAELHDESGGLTAWLVVNAARQGDHALHPLLDWEMSMLSLLCQAEALIREQRITFHGRIIPEYLSVMHPRDGLSFVSSLLLLALRDETGVVA